MSRPRSGEVSAILPKGQMVTWNRKRHSSALMAAPGGSPAVCARCGATGDTLVSATEGRYLCRACTVKGIPREKTVVIGKDLWDRYMASVAEARAREGLLQYLVDRGAAISDATQQELCEKAVTAKLTTEDVLQTIRDIAMSNGATGGALKFGPKPYQITIIV